jgi:glycosyltransferase involved in cell wall biosynthesis
MKVLHVITGLGIGGAELQLRQLIRNSQHQADVVTLYNPGVVADGLRSDGVRVTSLDMRSNTQVGALTPLVRLMRQGRYDVVHVHLYRACIYGRIAAKLAGVPVVVTTEHSVGDTHIERRRKTAGVRALYLATDTLSDATVAVSPAVRERLIRWGVRAGKITIIPNGVDFDSLRYDEEAGERVRAELGLSPTDYVIGVLGRLDPNKRYDLVIRAAASLLTPSCKLLLVGDGEERVGLEELVQAHGLEDRVVFAGERQDVRAVLSAMDLFVLSSAEETFGLVVLEALAAGLPVLYTQCPALDGMDVAQARQVSGDEASLASALAECTAHGRRPRHAVLQVQARYSAEAVARCVDTLYDRLRSERGPAREGLREQGTPIG